MLITEVVNMPYPPDAMERVMKVQQVILQALSGQLTWVQAADILGRTARSIRRLRVRYERYGYDGLFDRRRRTPSPKRAPVAEVAQVLQLYRERYGPRDGHRGFNVRHFHQLARRDHGPRPPSPAPRAPPVLRRTAAPGWQPPSVAGAAPRRRGPHVKRGALTVRRPTRSIRALLRQWSTLLHQQQRLVSRLATSLPRDEVKISSPTEAKRLACPKCSRRFALPINLGRQLSATHKKRRRAA